MVQPTAVGALVELILQADQQSYPPSSLDSVLQDPNGLPDMLQITARNHIDMSFINQGTADAQNFQSDWSVWVWNNRLMQAALGRILPHGYNQNLVGIPDYIMRLLFGGDYEEFPVSSAVDIKAAGGSYQGQIIKLSVPQGYFYALTRIAVDTSVGGTRSLSQQATDQMHVIVQRDRIEGAEKLVDYPAAGLVFHPDNDTSRIHSAKSWVIARQQLQIYLTANGAISNVPYHLVLRRYKEQPEHRALWGI